MSRQIQDMHEAGKEGDKAHLHGSSSPGTMTTPICYDHTHLLTSPVIPPGITQTTVARQQHIFTCGYLSKVDIVNDVIADDVMRGEEERGGGVACLLPQLGGH